MAGRSLDQAKPGVVRRLIEYCQTPLRVRWQWGGGRVAILRRRAITVAVASVSFVVTAWLLPGLVVASLGAAILAVILVSIFNAAIRPVILALFVPVSLILTGIAALVLQVVAVLFV